MRLLAFVVGKSPSLQSHVQDPGGKLGERLPVTLHGPRVGREGPRVAAGRRWVTEVARMEKPAGWKSRFITTSGKQQTRESCCLAL